LVAVDIISKAKPQDFEILSQRWFSGGAIFFPSGNDGGDGNRIPQPALDPAAGAPV
jgi:hypothetical protein